MITKAHEFKFVFLSSRDGDLRDFKQVEALFEKHKPTYVIHMAARVGGLYANMKDKVGFYEDNMQINMNIIKYSYKFGVKRLLCAVSTCIFPDKSTFPLKESYLHMGPPHPSNEGYAYAKRMVEVHCRLYNEQFGTDFVSIIPTNLYGNHDTFGERGHVVAGLIEKAYNAKENGTPFVVWGTGKPLR